MELEILAVPTVVTGVLGRESGGMGQCVGSPGSAPATTSDSIDRSCGEREWGKPAAGSEEQTETENGQRGNDETETRDTGDEEARIRSEGGIGKREVRPRSEGFESGR